MLLVLYQILAARVFVAIHRKKEYARADIPMLPVTHGEAFTKTWVLGYTALLMLVGFLPYLTGMSYLIYLVGSTLLNAGFVLRYRHGRCHTDWLHGHGDVDSDRVERIHHICAFCLHNGIDVSRSFTHVSKKNNRF